jgi:HlyD family secretion protein
VVYKLATAFIESALKTMDRELSTTTKKTNVKKRYLQAGLIITILGFAFFGFRNFVTPAIKRYDLLTALVEKGPVIASISASGVVVPEQEQVITSPIQAPIEQVYLNAGESCKTRDANSIV